MRKLSAVIRSLVSVTLLGSIVTACGSDLTSPEPTGTLVVTPGRLVLGAGMSRQLSASLVDQAGAPLTSGPITYISSDPSRASVSPDGLVSYVGPGQAEIRATSEAGLAIVPYTGLLSGHPLGITTTSARLPGDSRGDRPFGVAVDGEGRVFISQSRSGRVARGVYPDTGFTVGDLGGTPTSIALLGRGTALVTPSGPNADDASVIELSSGRVLTDVPLDVPSFSALTAPDSQTVYLGTSDGRILIFDVATSTVTGSVDLEVDKSRVNHLAINATGTLLYASSFTTGTISEIDLATRSVARLFVVGGEPQGIAVSLDGTELYVADEAGTGHIDIYDIVGNERKASIPSGATEGLGGPFGLGLSPDGTKLYVGVITTGIITTEDPGLIQVIDPAARRIERTITSCGRMPRRIAFGFSGGLAVIVDETGCATFVE